MKTIIHVHQQKIKKNEPAIIKRTYLGSTHHTYLEVLCKGCNEVAAKIVQSKTPDRCGARVVIQTELVRTLTDTPKQI